MQSLEIKNNNIKVKNVLEEAATQITLDEIFRLEDTNLPVSEIITYSSKVKITSVTPQSGAVLVEGKLDFSVLYSSLDGAGRIGVVNGSYDINEKIIMETVSSNSRVIVRDKIEDFKVRKLSPVKLGINALVMFTGINFEILDEEVSEDVEDESGESEIDCSYEKCQVTQIVTDLDEVINVTDSQELSQENPDIFGILWSRSEISSVSVRVMDDVTNITGNIETFIIYTPEDMEMPVQWVTLNVPFSENFDTPGTTPDMIPKEEVSISNLAINVKPNEDGVLRIIEQVVTLKVDLEVYKESEVKLLNDLFTPSCCLTPEKREIENENLIMRNTTKNRISGRVAASGGEGGILQVCNSSGNIKIDDVIKKENEVEIHGVVEASVMYITSDDKNSLKAVTTNIPFKQVVEAMSIKDQDSVEVWPRIEKMNANMISADEIDVRPNIVFDVSIFSKNKINVIDNVVSRPWSGEEIEKVPGIVGYIVKEGDTLMSIARKFFTTVKSIMDTNDLDSPDIKKGDKLVVVKQPPVALKN